MIDILLIIPSIAFISNLFIIAYVLGQRRKSPVNRAFLIFVAFMMLVPLIDFFLYTHLDMGMITILVRLLIVTMLALGFLFLNFVFELLEKNRDVLYWISFSLCILCLVLIHIFPAVTIVYPCNDCPPVPIFTKWLNISFFIGLLIIPSHAFWICIERMRNETNLQLISQLRLVIIGAFLSTFISIMTVYFGPMVLHDFVFLRFAPMGILINTLFMFRAIQRYYLLSVNVEQIEYTFNKIFDNVNDSVILLERNGNAVHINPSAHSLLGISVANLTRSFLEERIQGYDFSKDGTDMPASINNGLESRKLILSQSPVKNSDISLGKLLIIRDVTLQKKAEQQLIRVQNMESLGQLAAGIAHDFNNYLCGIISNISLVKAEINPNSKAAETLALGESTALSARELTRQLLTFSKGGVTSNENFDITELVREIAGFTVRGSGTYLNCDMDATPVAVKGDKGQIRQVFQNIVINSIQSMPNGGEIKIIGKVVCLCEGTVPDCKKGEYFKVEVIDQGYGIAPEILSNIFEPYFTTKPNGNGLGLAVVYSILSKHNGFITVSSQPGKGSIFTIYVPISSEPLVIQKLPGSSMHFGVGRLLIMDDYLSIRQSLARLLERFGYIVDQASTGKDALELFDRLESTGEHYGAVITDLTVPGGMGGRELACELHKRDPKLRIIVSSGYSEEMEISKYKEFGFSDVLHKPYSVDELRNVLEKLLNSRNVS